MSTLSRSALTVRLDPELYMQVKAHHESLGFETSIHDTARSLLRAALQSPDLQDPAFRAALRTAYASVTRQAYMRLSAAIEKIQQDIEDCIETGALLAPLEAFREAYRRAGVVFAGETPPTAESADDAFSGDKAA